jgi:hypothetical protein
MHGGVASSPLWSTNYEKENCALVKLVSALADSPTTVLQTLAERCRMACFFD